MHPFGSAWPRAVVVGATLAAGSAVLGGCWVGNHATSTTPTSTTTPPAAAFGNEAPTPPPATDQIPPVGPTWLETTEIGGLGDIVVDGSGRTVYASSTDNPNASTCYGECADTWLPLLSSGNPVGGIGIEVSAAQTIQRHDGSEQVTYRGHPLYWYAGDSAPGEINGHGVDLFGANWFILTPDGERASVG